MTKPQALKLSFEFFPPKTPEGMNTLQQTAAALKAFAPDFMSVTFGAGGSTRDGTLNTVKSLQQTCHNPITPHLSCLGLSRHDIIELLHTYRSLGMNQLVALRGDLPAGHTLKSEMTFAHELVTLIREVTGDYFHIYVGAYPECHPDARDFNADLINLKKKMQAGANTAITQYFFNPDAYFHFLDQCANQHIFIPIIPGIMPITNLAKLIRFSDMCGAEIPRWLRKQLENFKDNSQDLNAFCTEVVYDLCQRLIQGGAPGLHFYTLNQAEATLPLVELLGLHTASSRLREVTL